MKAQCLAVIGLSLIVSGAHAQSAPSGKTLAATINVYVFPNNGQTASQQSKDEGECYNWATMNTGTDPFELQKQAASDQQQAQQQAQQAQNSTKGAGARGAVGGAAAGALIGEIADTDRSEAAAWGAALGAVHNRRKADARSQPSPSVGSADRSVQGRGYSRANHQLQEGVQRLPRVEEVHGEVLSGSRVGGRQPAPWSGRLGRTLSPRRRSCRRRIPSRTHHRATPRPSRDRSPHRSRS